MSLFQYLICSLVIVWLYWLWTRRHYYAKILELPGPLGYPFIGYGIKFLRAEDILNSLHQLNERYGPLAYTWLGTSPLLMITEPDIIRDVLTSPSCINKSTMYKGVDIALGRGLIGLPGTTMGKSASQDSRDSQRNLLKSYHCFVENITKMVFSPWLRTDIARKLVGIYKPLKAAQADIEQFIRNLITEKLANEKDHIQLPGAKHIFIDQAIDLAKRNIFTTQHVEVESNTIVIGAFETTANTIAFTLILLAMFPEYQQQAFEELLSIFPQSGEFEVTYANIQDMVYLDRIIQESMRVLSPIPFVARQNTQDLKLSNGVVLPKGTQIGISIFGLHRRKDIWGPDADIFNPDNFLPLNMEGKHPYAYIPFLKGLRNCIGWKYGLMTTKVALAKLLRNYRFSTDFQYKDLEFIENIVLKLKKVPALRIHKREV